MLYNLLFILPSLKASQNSPQELDKSENNLLDDPCYLWYNVIDSKSCQVAHFDNVVSEKGQTK